jgi:hypothetical protein
VDSDNTGECFWNERYDKDVWDFYYDNLGSDWNSGFWSPPPRTVQYLVAALLIPILMTFQFATFLVLGSDFCDENNCEFGRSAGLSVGVAGGLCFFFSSLLFVLMKDYPGVRVFRLLKVNHSRV